MTDEQRPEGTPASTPSGGDTVDSAPADESPTQAWPSLATPPPPAQTPSPSMPAVSQSQPEPWEPSTSLPEKHVSTVSETGTFGAASPPAGSRRGTGLRWIVAIVGVALVAAVSVAVAALIGGKPVTSTAMGYMPKDIVSYTEIRLDLPGDQRQKLASFMKPIPGFDDSSQFDTKLNELFDQVLGAASHDEVLWTRDISPWFAGELAVGTGIPSTLARTGMDATSLFVATVKDRAKTIDWIQKAAKGATFDRSTYGDADLLAPAAASGQWAIAVNDKVLLAGSTEAVKAAIDSGGKTTWTQTDDVVSALATVDKDYVMVGVTRVKAMADAIVSLIGKEAPDKLAGTQLDETVLGMLPAWFANSGRFENDAFVTTSVGPAGKVGYDTSNRPDQIVGHIPASTLLVASEHDAGPTLSAMIAKFRPLPEAKPFFDQFDRALSLLGGFDAVAGWWGDTAIVVSKLNDGTIGGGLVVKPRDAAAADRLFTALNGFVALGGSSAGATVRTADHNGTKVTVVDFSAAGSSGLPPGYKPEIAWATNADIAVVGYGETFVNAVLDSGAGHSLADDARFKGLLERAGSDNIALTFVDIKALRTLLEPLAQASAPAEAWDQYTKRIQPYLAPIDALIATGRKDGSNDRGVTFIATPR
ncbi:MAG TPA: DUF3352 domain-containing protein [Candidatus Limnocylindrales bacterium]|nr:DUF3352 domain-containing protein [Candidatus Limnocylindrales bacterium]